jgi:flagella basal body P-ring formation protein FlgA
VRVDWRDGGLTLTIQGQAQSSAAVGQPLRVLNPASRRVIDTVATGPGRAVAGPEAQGLRAQLLSNPAAARLALR